LDKSVNSMNTARVYLAGSNGTQTAALAFGGATPPATGATEEYDGTSWTTSPTSLNTARRVVGWKSRNTSCSFSFWWSPIPGGPGAATEEWTGAGSANNKNNNGKLIWQNI
jgi:hypothetical protein